MSASRLQEFADKTSAKRTSPASRPAGYKRSAHGSLSGAGEPVLKVLDFGIAKILDWNTSGERTIATQMGTPQYCAPEQLGPGVRSWAAARNITIADRVTPQTDIWGLTLLMYELLTFLSNLQVFVRAADNVVGPVHVELARRGLVAGKIPGDAEVRSS